MPKRILSGVVVSSNSNKTIIVNVTRRIKHKLYKKITVTKEVIVPGANLKDPIPKQETNK